MYLDHRTKGSNFTAAQHENLLNNTHEQTAVLPDDISKANPEVIAHHPVHAYFLIGAAIVGQYDANGLPPFLALQQHSVPPEKLKLVHLGLQL